MPKTYVDLLWDLKKDVEDKLELEGAFCDFITEPLSLISGLGWKCRKGKVGFEIMNDQCKLFVLDVPNIPEVLTELRRESDLDLSVSPYDIEKPREPWVDVEIRVPCNKETILEYFRRLDDVVSKHQEEWRKLIFEKR